MKGRIAWLIGKPGDDYFTILFHEPESWRRYDHDSDEPVPITKIVYFEVES